MKISWLWIMITDYEITVLIHIDACDSDSDKQEVY